MFLSIEAFFMFFLFARDLTEISGEKGQQSFVLILTLWNCFTLSNLKIDFLHRNGNTRMCWWMRAVIYAVYWTYLRFMQVWQFYENVHEILFFIVAGDHVEFKRNIPKLPLWVFKKHNNFKFWSCGSFFLPRRHLMNMLEMSWINHFSLPTFVLQRNHDVLCNFLRPLS